MTINKNRPTSYFYQNKLLISITRVKIIKFSLSRSNENASYITVRLHRSGCADKAAAAADSEIGDGCTKLNERTAPAAAHAVSAAG